MDRSYNKTTSRLPKLVSSTNTDTAFKDDNLRDTRLDFKLRESNVDMFSNPGSYRFLTEGYNRKPSEESPERINTQQSLDQNLVRSNTEDILTYITSHPTKRSMENRDNKDMKAISGRFRELKTKNTPEYSISDFYLKTFNKEVDKLKDQTSSIEYDTARRSNYSKNNNMLKNESLLEMSQKSIGSSEGSKRNISNTRLIFDELAKLVENKTTRTKFFDSIGVFLREFYFNHKEYFPVFDDIDIALFCLDEVTQKVKCYRAELGFTMDKLLTSFRKLFERLLKLAMKLDTDKEENFKNRNEEMTKALEKLGIEKRVLEDKIKAYKQLSDIRESEAKMFDYNTQSLENEIKMLHELLKKDYLLDNTLDPFDEQRKKFEIEQEKLRAPSVALNKNLITLQNELYEFEEAHEKNAYILKDMNNVLKAMLRGTKKDVMIQVDEGELGWRFDNLYNDQMKQPKNKDLDQKDIISINYSSYLTKELQDKGRLEGVDVLKAYPVEEQMKKQEEKKPEAGSSPEKKKNSNSLDAHQLANQQIIDSWNLPLPVILFIENVSRTKEMASVLPWNHFKKIIYDIYKERVKDSNEITSHLIASNLPFYEYVCLYFLKIHKLRRMAEIKLMEFLVSLRYYIRHWQRAITFANLCQISNLRLPGGVTNVQFGEECDIYVQNFFIFAFSKVIVLQDFVFDTQDGITHILKDKIEELTDEVLVFESEEKRKKFISTLQKHIRFFNDGESDKEGLDLDRLLNMYVEAFFEARTRNIQNIQKSYMKLQGASESVLSIDDFNAVCQEVIGEDSPILGLSFAKEFTLVRALMYSLTSGPNTHSVTFEDLSKSITKFGIDCPLPFISNSNIGVKLISGDVLNSARTDDRQIGSARNLFAGPKKSKTFRPSGYGLSGGIRSDTKLRADDEISMISGKGFSPETRKRQDPEVQKLSLTAKLDNSSALFAQHYSIIREMRSCCLQFKDTVRREVDVDILKKSFEQILQVLDVGTTFLSYPVSY